MRGADKQHYLFDPPTSRRTKDPEGGEMVTGRGKKGKKWHLILGLKDVIFAGIGIVGLIMMSFALGALAGRGEIYRMAYSWGLLDPEAKPSAQVTPQVAALPAPAASALAPPANTPTPVPASSTLAAPPGGPGGKQEAALSPTVAKGSQPPAVAGSMTPWSPPAAAASSKKNSRAAQAQREQKAREDQLRQERQEVASKLTFLNSFDTSSKPGHKKEKATAKPQPTLVKVGTYRDSKTAQAKLGELQKKGIKVTLKPGKDENGTFYTLYRQNPPSNPKESDNLAQKKEKAAGANPKGQAE